jgi:hypothetical protein
MVSAGILVGLLFLNGLFPVVWFSPAVYGKVVDQTTGIPIANAAVAASWRLTSWESSTVRCLQLSEATTDAEGKFRIPAWGPTFHFGSGNMDRTQPELYVIADGYSPLRSSSSGNVTSAYIYAGPGMNGREFELRRAELSDAYERDLADFWFFLATPNKRDCDAFKVPQAGNRVVNGRIALSEIGRGAGLP